ncbi:MAG TPA: methylated-DNA--[protein]-cysteine S-methyltransferase [Polyangia bacterium]|nr:methylated-DNA--[protein]-cysteine S-methyltransferase [Polyangia bacterium]
MNTTTYFTVMTSPVGPLTLVADDEGLIGLHFESDPAGRQQPDWVRDDRRFRQAVTQLGEYFAGRRRTFDLPLAPRGTEFRKLVWKALRAIPYGQTASYGEIARAIGQPQASRAIGGANHHNPLAIVIPCHRVIGADGSMTGYGGGLARKRLLLDLEAGGR